MKTAILVFLATASSALAQCTKDIECKGERVCVSGACVESGLVAQSQPGLSAPPSAVELVSRREEPSNPYRIHRILGIVALSSTWGLTVAGSLIVGDAYFFTTALPVVGPWVTYLLVSGNPNATFLQNGQALLITAGVLQAASLGYLVWAVIAESSWAPRFAIGPGPTPAGLSVSFRGW